MSKSQLARLSAQVPEIKAMQERVVELERALKIIAQIADGDAREVAECALEQSNER